MNIACVGWGSLIWDPRGLPIQRCWFSDGPLLPLEFARHSRSDYVSLVIVPGARAVRSLWVPLTISDLETARQKLAEREGIDNVGIARSIGWWTLQHTPAGHIPAVIGKWAVPLGLDAVVWTNLPPRFNNVERVPSVGEVLQLLRQLPQPAQQRAEEYIRKAPRQIDTTYRRAIEAQLGWTPMNSGDVAR